MKPIAYFPAACLLFLSSLQGNGSVTQSTSIAACCKGVSCNHGKHTQQDKGCDSKACNRMASCGRCGFVVTEQLLLLDQIDLATDKPILFSTIGIVTGYPQIGWHPPKV